MEEIDTVLAYKSSPKIIQEKDAFSFSIDSTLLSFFCDIKLRMDGIIDLGSGNGIIPLILSLRTDKKIYGVEIQKSSYDRSLRSVLLNKLENQIEIINDDIKNVYNLFSPSSFSLVTSNPPYFKVIDSSIKNENEELTIARHEVLINMEEIIKAAFYLLKDGGSLSFVQRTERFIETLDLLKKYGFSPKRVRFVYPKTNKESHVFLIDARKRGKDHGLKILPPLYIYDLNNDYSKEVLTYFHYGEENEKK